MFLAKMTKTNGLNLCHLVKAGDSNALSVPHVLDAAEKIEPLVCLPKEAVQVAEVSARQEAQLVSRVPRVAVLEDGDDRGDVLVQLRVKPRRDRRVVHGTAVMRVESPTCPGTPTEHGTICVDTRCLRPS